MLTLIYITADGSAYTLLADALQPKWNAVSNPPWARRVGRLGVPKDVWACKGWSRDGGRLKTRQDVGNGFVLE